MEIFKEIVAWMVAISGAVAWTMFVPQIRLLLKVKESRSISIALMWGSVAIQVIALVHVTLKADWPLAFVYSTSLICLGIVLYLIYYYRKWPGGKPVSQKAAK